MVEETIEAGAELIPILHGSKDALKAALNLQNETNTKIYQLGNARNFLFSYYDNHLLYRRTTIK